MSIRDIDEAALRERAHAVQGLYAEDPGGDGCYLNHGRDGQSQCDRVTAELRRHAELRKNFAEASVHVAQTCADAVKKAHDQRDAALADVARLTKECGEAAERCRALEGAPGLLSEACVILDEAREALASAGAWQPTGIEVRIATFVHRDDVTRALTASSPGGGA